MLGIIAGTGLYNLSWLKDTSKQLVDTPYGKPSGPLVISQNQQLYFMARHGDTHNIPPHKINYRANVQVMADTGVKKIILINTVGACDQFNEPGSIVMPDQIIDYSYGREHTFFDELDSFNNHIDFTLPFSESMRSAMLAAAKTENIQIENGGTYGCTQGPRLETAAEIKRLKNDGCDLVGMTLMPEAALCRERNIETLSLCVVVNAAAGVAANGIAFEDMVSAMEQGVAKVERLLYRFVV